ncbi:hypothetical protein [Streptomyces sp. NPDC047981]|uniref:hypothetical protein n=1 Tax=Streptomyces sp. NPDC047981 TaxID=3154610 RepID=UPI00344593D9
MSHHDYVRQLAAELDLAAVFRIPCPGTPYGPFADLLVEKRLDGHGDGSAIVRDSEVWTGTRWEHRTALAASDTYRWADRGQALAEAQRIVPEQTAALHALHEERRHG